MQFKTKHLFAIVLLALSAGSMAAQRGAPAAPAPGLAPWVEPDFPFFSSVLDARQAGPGFPADNLTPRAIVLNLGRDHWVAFDLDLLRVAAMWRGSGVTPTALAPGSHLKPDRKTPGGQNGLPTPDGTVWLANGIYPGWQLGDEPAFTDPREPAPSVEEVGRGPLPEAMGRFKAVRLVANGAVFDYTVGGADVQEWVTLSNDVEPAIERQFRVGPSTRPLWLVLGVARAETGVVVTAGSGFRPAVETLTVPPAPGQATGSTARVRAVRIPPHTAPAQLMAAFTERGAPGTAPPRAIPTAVARARWPQEVVTKVTLSSAEDAYVVDDIGLPVENPWRRAVRPGDVQFLKDGTAAIITLDGDVWLARGLQQAGGSVRWRRFGSGLHEPLTLAIRDDQIYAFDRNGIWRLRDTNGDGEADVHELFSNAFAQTADTREFPATIRLGPGGEFVIAKGGQEATTIGKHNGSILRISADGRRADVLGYGFRQPNLSVNIKTGLVIASDQQGNYIPSTPLHIVKDRQFYGFLSDKLPKEVYPAAIADPIVWLPHAANASALSQVWMFNAKMGPLNDGLVHIGFNNPEIFRVLLNNRSAKPQAAVVSITRAFDFPTLNGSVNPVDGQLYIAGLQILGWGTTATRLTGMGRVRYTGAPMLVPNTVVPMDKGVLLRFEVPLDPRKAVDRDNYSLTSWNYKRTYQYGSPQYKADGSLGIDTLPASQAYLAKDGRTVFVAVPGMKPSMQMRLAWTLATADGTPFQQSAYFTPYELPPFDPASEGFATLTVDLTPRTAPKATETPVSPEEGRRLAQLYGCVACHSIDGNTVVVGPTWKGLFGSERPYAKGSLKVTADEGYLRESILEPAVKVVSGFERADATMPSYGGVLTDSQIESILLFIKTLK